HALRRLDPERIGMAMRVVLCMPPGSDGKIHSLRESVGQGTPPWRADLEQEAIFLGAESLAGYVVTSCRPDLVQNYGREHYQLPASWAEHELSATAIPIMYTNRIAGCVLVSSAQPDFFNSSSRRTLIADYTQLIALAFKPEQVIDQRHDVLDAGGGTGGWVLETAYAYPHKHATDIDISQGMIDYANGLARANVLDNAQFRVANAIDPLDFPNTSFDLVNV